MAVQDALGISGHASRGWLGGLCSILKHKREQRQMRLLFQLCLQGNEAHCEVAVMRPILPGSTQNPSSCPGLAPQPSLSLGSLGLEGALDFTVCVCPSCGAGVWESFSGPFSPSPRPPSKIKLCHRFHWEQS